MQILSQVWHPFLLKDFCTEFTDFCFADETEDKIRRAALIAAELAAINDKKSLFQSNSLTASPVPQLQSVPKGLYARVDLIQKHKDRLLREQRLKEGNSSSDEQMRDGTDTSFEINYMKIHESTSYPEIYSHSSGNYESITVSALDLSRQTRLLKDNMIFVGHPGVGVTNCDNLSRVTQSGTNSDLKRVYTITP